MSSTLSRHTGVLSLLVLTFALSPIALAAQAPADTARNSEAECNKLPTRSERNDCEEPRIQTRTIFLKNVTEQNDANEIMIAVRNVSDPGTKIYMLSMENAIVVSTYPEQQDRIESLIHTLDRLHKSYRLAYTITELDGDKTVSTQHMSMVAVVGQRTSVKEGDKIPLATGTTGENNSTQTQFTYIDVGMNFDATIEQQGDGVSLKSKVEQSSVGPTNTIAGVAEPVIRQTVLEGTSNLTLGKPVMLGSIDVPTTTRRFDIAVVLEPIK
jgi:type II secretory pathway component GspD/PulD (secretin)